MTCHFAHNETQGALLDSCLLLRTFISSLPPAEITTLVPFFRAKIHRSCGFLSAAIRRLSAQQPDSLCRAMFLRCQLYIRQDRGVDTSAQVLLGLLPAVLVFLGPTIAEVSALSTYRPLLATILALGSPATNIIRILRRIDLNKPFVQTLSTSSRIWPAWVFRQKPFLRSSLRGLSYVAALAAVANNIWISIYTDLRTIIYWRCGVLFMPLAWSLAAVVVPGLGMTAIRVRQPRSGRPRVRFAVKSKIFQTASIGKDSILSEIILWVASFGAIIQLTTGVLVLSSMVFITVTEAFQVFLQYALSSFVCQIIMNIELANMRYELETASSATQAGLRMA